MKIRILCGLMLLPLTVFADVPPGPPQYVINNAGGYHAQSLKPMDTSCTLLFPKTIPSSAQITTLQYGHEAAGCNVLYSLTVPGSSNKSVCAISAVWNAQGLELVFSTLGNCKPYQNGNQLGVIFTPVSSVEGN